LQHTKIPEKIGGTGGCSLNPPVYDLFHTWGRVLQGGGYHLPCSSAEPKDNTILKDFYRTLVHVEKTDSLIVRTHMEQR